jgi:hypothetical protein
MKTVTPISIDQLSILSIKSFFGVTFEFLLLSKIIENYACKAVIGPCQLQICRLKKIKFVRCGWKIDR